MENRTPKSNSNNSNHSNSNSDHQKKKNHRKQSSQMSISDTDSLASQLESFHSPLRSDSPFRSDDPFPDPNSKSIVAVDRYYSPQRSPSNFTPPPPPPPPANRSASKIYRNRSSAEEAVTKVERIGRRGDLEGGEVRGGEWRLESPPVVSAAPPPPPRVVLVSRAALGFRVCEVLFCLISFSIMAKDRTQGWSGDSWDRYKEFRYCLTLNVIGFVYSGLQGVNLAYRLASNSSASSLRYQFDFLMDQILAYLLMSASSSAATRVDDWVLNWGKDEFTKKASASIAMSFLAFIAFAFSSIISGYSLSNHNS